MNGANGNRRVVVTGMGIVSCLGNDQVSVTASLRELEAGIQFIPEYADLGLRSQVAGRPQIDLDALIDRKLKRFMGDAAARSEEHTSELQSLMRISYAVFCLNKKTQTTR